jgi:hypothetical protein
MTQLIPSIFCAILIAASANAFAHGEISKPKHGGVMAKAEPLEAELVATPSKVTLHVFEHSKPVAAKGGSAVLTLLNGKSKTEVVLKPAADNTLGAEGEFEVKKGTRIVGALTMVGHKTLSMRWAIK